MPANCLQEDPATSPSLNNVCTFKAFKNTTWVQGFSPTTMTSWQKGSQVLQEFGGRDIVTAARILYAKNWKSPTVPKQEDLIEKIWETVEMDILLEVMKDCPLQKATERWDLFYKWIELTDSV